MVTTMRRCLAGLALLLATFASAQTPPVLNPSRVTFTASDDHALVSSYVIGYFAVGATDPIQETDLGKPTPDAQNVCSVALNTRPLAFGLGYVARVKAVAGAMVGPYSEPSNPFDRVPGKPGGPVVK